MIRRLLSVLALLSVLSILPSCIDHDQTLIINPDGSGKVKIKTSIAPSMGGLKADKTKEVAKELVVTMLRAKGIDAWTDVSHSADASGKISVSGTAYFPDITKLEIPSGFDDPGESASEFTKAEKDDKGNWVFEEDLAALAGKGEKEADSEDKDEPKNKALTDEEIDAKVQESAAMWGFMEGMMKMMFGEFAIKGTIQAGTVIEANFYEQSADNKTASMGITGERLISQMGKMMTDEKKLRSLLKEGKSPEDFFKDPSAMAEMMLGKVGTPRLVVTPPAEPFFKYSEEVAKAKASVSDELKGLLADAAKPAEKGKGLEALLGGALDGLGGEEKEEEEEEAPKPKRSRKPADADKPKRVD